MAVSRESRAIFGRDERVCKVILRRRPLTLDLVGVDRVDGEADVGANVAQQDLDQHDATSP